MSTTESACDYVVRLLQSPDAQGLPDLVRRVYGSHYSYHDELYHPEEVIALNEAGALISAVALDLAGQVVGHCGLMRETLGRVGETGESMVDPQHRSHHLMHRMRALLYEEAGRRGLLGVYGSPVTNHVLSQKVYEAFGSHPTGFMYLMLPASFANLGHPLPQRMTDVTYFKYLSAPPRTTAHAPGAYRDILARIYAQFGTPVEFEQGRPLGGEGHVVCTYVSRQNCATIDVLRVGSNVVGQIRTSRAALTALGADVVYLQLPLAHPATPELCERAREEGFFFSSLAPLACFVGDALRMQYCIQEVDTNLLQLENSFARELLAFIRQDRQRVQGNG